MEKLDPIWQMLVNNGLAAVLLIYYITKLKTRLDKLIEQNKKAFDAMKAETIAFKTSMERLLGEWDDNEKEFIKLNEYLKYRKDKNP